MRGGGLKIGKIFGIPIFLHTSWFLIFLLNAYLTATSFGATNPNQSQIQNWSLGTLTSLLFFASVLFHELAHSVVAKHYRIPVASITLFFFGGVARISREPERPGQEFLIAIAGPVSSYFLAGSFLLLGFLSPQASAVRVVATTLGVINAYLATFNLLPGFPMDGGRILRSIIWGITKNYTRSTRIAARGGQVVAFCMMGFGVFTAIQAYKSGGDPMDGLWYVLIGWFVLGMARQSSAQVEMRGVLEGLRAADIMTPETPTISRDISLEEYSQEAARTGRRGHLVVADGQLVGLMTVGALQSVPREEWPMTSVQAVMLSRDRLPWAAPDEPALQLLDRMRSANVDQMAVIASGSVVGLVTRDSILRVIETRNSLGQVASR
jgi:Zn-dependent protease/predicted transcriptional regulator